MLIDDGSPRRFGPALAWAWQQRAADLDVLVEGVESAGVVARRSVELLRPPSVWAVQGRALQRIRPAPPEQPAAMAPGWADYVGLMQAHGAEPRVEHGVLRGEVLGLEVARLDEGRFEIGVGRHDRAARDQLDDQGLLNDHGQLDDQGRVGRALDEAVAAVRARRRPGAAPHPANALARSRWLRSVVCAQPELADAAVLAPRPPPLPSAGVTDNGAVPAVGTSVTGSPLVVVCSTGIDLDLIPTAADSRRMYEPDAGLVIVVPEGDDHPVTLALAAALTRPAAVRTVPRSWVDLSPAS